MSELLKTPLHDVHIKYKGKLIDFGGWELPVQYSGIIEEHQAVRQRAGLFDVSHMGEIDVTGPDSSRFVQYLVTNDISKMEDCQVMYTPMCYTNGGVVDDLLVYKKSDDHYLLVVNASNTDKDFSWISENAEKFDVTTSNVSAKVAQMAIQGPLAQDILQKLTTRDLGNLKFFFADHECPVAGRTCLVSRTGYTGEDGFEIYCRTEDAEHIWESIMEAGSSDGILPAGLGARDTLRFEACLPLYGHELNADVTPLESSLGFFVKLEKDDFIGKDVLSKQKTDGLKRKVVGLEMLDRGIARQGYEVKDLDGNIIGHVTSGSTSPTLSKNIALALISTDFSKPGNEVFVVIRGKTCRAVTVKTPFYKKAYRKE